MAFDCPALEHLDLLVGFIRTAYASTTERLVPLLEQHQITYDLLWTLFKPNTLAHTKCFGTGQPRCVRYEFGVVRSHGRWQNVFPVTYFFCTKGPLIVIANRTSHERMVNIKYCICRDRGVGDEDVQIKLEILKTKIPYQQSSPATGAHLTPRLFPLSCG